MDLKSHGKGRNQKKFSIFIKKQCKYNQKRFFIKKQGKRNNLIIKFFLHCSCSHILIFDGAKNSNITF